MTSLAMPAAPAGNLDSDAAPPAAGSSTPAPGAAGASASDAGVDDPAEWQAWTRPCEDAAQPAGACESHIAVGGMYCAACSFTVEDALMAVPGVLDARVNGTSGAARITWLPSATRPSLWLAAIARAGYTGSPLADMTQSIARDRAARMMLWRLLVAGFCMMQVMMYAVPAYLAAPGEMTREMVLLLRWASWVLTLPVVLFSCWPFFSSAWRDLRAGRVGMDVPVAAGIAIAFAASSAATFDPGAASGEVWFDSLTMFVFFLLGGRMLEQRLRNRTAGALEALSSRLPDTVERRIGEGLYERVSARRIVPGDVIRVSPGETFPADGSLLAGRTQVDEALLTGESLPLHRDVGEPVLAGSHNLSGLVLVTVERTGAQTRYADIVALMRQAASGKPRIAQLADRIARPFLVAVLVAAAAAAALWWRINPSHAIGVAIAVLVVTCPCALSLATPAAILAAAGTLARRGILVRELQALDACARIDTVIFDKTGTLTHDRMTVGAIRTRRGLEPEQALALAGALACHSLHPASRAIAARATEEAFVALHVEETAGQGVSGEVRTRCVAGGEAQHLRLGNAAFCGAPPSRLHAETAQVHLADARGWLASFDLEEEVRPDAAQAVRALLARGIRVQLLSGDRTHAVARLAIHLGIEWALGDRSPADKLAHVEFLQKGGHRVMMVGDGINDAPVLARADVSVSFAHAAPVSRSGADVVLMGEGLMAVDALIAASGRTRRVVWQNLAWAAAYNAVCVPLAVAGLMPPWLAGLGMAGSSLVVVLNAARLARFKSAGPAHDEKGA